MSFLLLLVLFLLDIWSAKNSLWQKPNMFEMPKRSSIAELQSLDTHVILAHVSGAVWNNAHSKVSLRELNNTLTHLYLSLDHLKKKNIADFCSHLFWFLLWADATYFVLSCEEYFLLLSSHFLTVVIKPLTINYKAWPNLPLCRGGGSAPSQWTFSKVTKQTFQDPSNPLATSHSSSQFSSLFLQTNPPILHHSPGANFEGQLI